MGPEQQLVEQLGAEQLRGERRAAHPDGAVRLGTEGGELLDRIAAGDAILPRQLRKRGHRLVYSNGILVLSAAAVFLVITFRADTHHLIQLYAIGVVTSFTLA
jgi:hypothetical protein